MPLSASQTPTSDEAIQLLKKSNIAEFNQWRMKNLTSKIDISGMDFSKTNLAGAYLNGVRANSTNFAGSELSAANLVQAELNNCNFANAILRGTLFMYSELKGANFVGADLSSANFMWADAQAADFSSSKMLRTIMVEALLQNAKMPQDSSGAFVKFAKLEGTLWASLSSSTH